MVNSIGSSSDIVSTYSGQRAAQLQKPEIANLATTPQKLNKTESKPLTSAVALDSPVNESSESPAEKSREPSGQGAVEGIRQLASQENSNMAAFASQATSSREAGLRAYQQTAMGM